MQKQTPTTIATLAISAFLISATTSGAIARPVAVPPSQTKAGQTPSRKTFGLPEVELEIMLRNHKCQEAKALLARCKRVPGDEDARKIYQACIEGSADEVEEACKTLEQVHNFDDAATPVLVIVGKNYAANNQCEKALKISTIAYNRDHSLLAGDLRAAVLMQLKKFKEGCEQYKSDAKNNPAAARGALCKAASVQLYDLHNPAEALKLIQQAKDSSTAPPEVLLYYSTGECYRALNEPKKALAAYTSGIDLEKSHNRVRSLESKVAYCNMYKARSAVYKQLGMVREGQADTMAYDKLSNEAAEYLLHK